MALTRTLLKGLGLTEEQIGTVIDAHAETVTGLKDQLEKYRKDAEALPGVQAELEKAKEAAKASGDAAKIQKAFDDYKAEVKAKETKAAKETALRKIAKDAGLTEAGIAKAVKYTDYDALELDEKGEVKDAKALIKSLKEEWPEHIAKTTTSGANTSTPPGNQGNNGKYSSKEEIMKIKDAGERQKAIAENMNLFTGPARAETPTQTEGE